MPRMTFEIGERVRRRDLSGGLVEGCVVDAVPTSDRGVGGHGEGERQQMLVVLIDRLDGRSAPPREVAGLARVWSKAVEA